MKTIKNLILVIVATIYLTGCSSSVDDTYTDVRDGKVYKTVKIGNQVWMAENLAYKPNDGNFWAYDNDEKNVTTYGFLYDWETACEVCPDGWYLPSKVEWDTLILNLGGEKIAGGKLKESSTKYWKSPNTGATNISGFSALPGGLYKSDKFKEESLNAYFWTIDESFGEYGWTSSGSYKLKYKDGGVMELEYNNSEISNRSRKKYYGISVRCIKDKLIQ